MQTRRSTVAVMTDQDPKSLKLYARKEDRRRGVGCQISRQVAQQHRESHVPSSEATPFIALSLRHFHAYATMSVFWCAVTCVILIISPRLWDETIDHHRKLKRVCISAPSSIGAHQLHLPLFRCADSAVPCVGLFETRLGKGGLPP